jgi:hypothetical protein
MDTTNHAPLLPAGLLPGPFPGVTVPLTEMTENALAAVGWGPAGEHFASAGNWQRYYANGTPQGTGQAGEHAA